jgi:hypothetical protein
VQVEWFKSQFKPSNWEFGLRAPELDMCANRLSAGAAADRASRVRRAPQVQTTVWTTSASALARAMHAVVASQAAVAIVDIVLPPLREWTNGSAKPRTTVEIEIAAIDEH